MKAQLINNTPQTWAVIFETGDEVISGLTGFARHNGLTASQFTAIGAFSTLELGYFDFTKRDYTRIPIREQVEVLSLLGDIALKDGSPQLHAHTVVGKADGTAHGGHLMSATVRPTLEVVIVEAPSHLRREMDESTGLALITLRTSKEQSP